MIRSRRIMYELHWPLLLYAKDIYRRTSTMMTMMTITTTHLDKLCPALLGRSCRLRDLAPVSLFRRVGKRRYVLC
jgi:hypothetical protein